MMIFMVLFPKDVEVGGGKDGKPYAKQEGCEHVPSEMAARFGFVVLSHACIPNHNSAPKMSPINHQPKVFELGIWL